ncbi:DNA segregation ATPase FtsK/SpoIIIE and related proteins [Butyrivibrio fibrisolvens 16/4]|nr:DNA segregation ATPase FtsK/SpoIIIE and related proteins [Butyrivibrio fibrisolvens 16/4]
MVIDDLADNPKKLKESYSYLYNVPVTLDLNQHKMIGIIGGKNKDGCYPIMQIIASQVAAVDCYIDVKMAFVYDENRDSNSSQWQFARWFPHVWAEDKKTRFVAGNKNEAREVFYEIARVLRSRSEDSNITKRGEFARPYYILFIENPTLIEGELISKYLSADSEDNVGITTIVMANSYEELPNSCEYIIENTDEFKGIYNVTDRIEERVHIDFDAIDIKALEKFSRRLSSIQVKENELGGEIPSTLSFFEMYKINHLEELNVEERWRKNRTYDSMRALIGQKSGGSDCYLDVHEKYHGPHGLIAGTTGSGKSETLQTFILSLALNYSPEDIGFFIIDYKGGGMANLFNHLPHMLGSISNLSGNQVKRAMVSIKSENKKRQRIFNEYGVNNINQYTRLYKNKEAKIPVPHLFIIIDEFAELKKEQSEFMSELVSVAQVGRSLGVHLILATQRPSGTVDENIWANSKFKLCLRVQDRKDSMEMLHKPDAAYLTQAGRCYLQVGNDEVYELFQSGWSGAIYDKTAELAQTNIAQMISVNGKAALVGSHAKMKLKEKNRDEWIDLFIKYIDNALISENLTFKDCKGDSFAIEKIVNDIFIELSDDQVEYPWSIYNHNRVIDLINVCIELNEQNTEINAQNIIRYAIEKSLRLPEAKEKHS